MGNGVRVRGRDVRALTALAGLLVLGACATAPAAPAPSPVACSAIDLAEVEAAPVPPEVDRLAVYKAIIGALPLEAAKSWVRFYEVELPGHARRLHARATAHRERCL